MEYKAVYSSPLGNMTMLSDGDALTVLAFDGQRYNDPAMSGEYDFRNLEVFSETKRWLDVYFSGHEPDFTPALRPKGSEFRMTVWELLMGIPYGRQVTYGELAAEAAARLGRARMAAQAVGGAVGHNPIALIIPCHRVIGADGSLTGYGGGLERKRELLKLEKSGAGSPICPR